MPALSGKIKTSFRVDAKHSKTHGMKKTLHLFLGSCLPISLTTSRINEETDRSPYYEGLLFPFLIPGSKYIGNQSNMDIGDG